MFFMYSLLIPCTFLECADRVAQVGDTLIANKLRALVHAIIYMFSISLTNNLWGLWKLTAGYETEREKSNPAVAHVAVESGCNSLLTCWTPYADLDNYFDMNNVSMQR